MWKAWEAFIFKEFLFLEPSSTHRQWGSRGTILPDCHPDPYLGTEVYEANKTGTFKSGDSYVSLHRDPRAGCSWPTYSTLASVPTPQ